MENNFYETKPESKEVDPRINRALELYRKLLAGERGVEVYDKLAAFTQKIEAEHPEFNIREYAVFHIASGSGVKIPWSEFSEDRIDLPGELSILKFLEQLDKEYEE